jgi:hypothetical protein
MNNFKEIALPQHLTPARALAEAAFKKLSRPIIMTEYEVQAQTIRERTARLRKLRLDKESPSYGRVTPP